MEASLSTRVFIVELGLAKYHPIDDPRKATKYPRADFDEQAKTPTRRKSFRFRLVKRPPAVEYARVYICRANRRRVFKRELVSSTQMIEDSDAADKSDTVLKTKERRIHNGWRW